MKRFFRSRQLIVAADSRTWAVKVPPRANVVQVEQRGTMIFMSIDMSDVPRDQRVEFVHLQPQEPPAGTFKLPVKGGGGEYLS